MALPVDPRSNPSIGADFVSGQITDKALALLDILNQVTGTQGRSVKQIDVLEDGQVSNLTLGVHNIQADYDAQPWAANQIVYFQSTPQRLALIQQQLQDNLTRIESDITSNIGTLFDLIQKNVANGGLDIEGQLNSAEANLNAANGDQILIDGKTLEDKITALLTSDTALDTIIDAFIAKFNLDIHRLDSEIFNLMDDQDGVFSSDANGQDSTSSVAAKYLVSFGAGKPAVIASSLDEVFDLTFKSPYEEKFGVGTWTSDAEDGALANFTSSLFQKGALSLDPGLINAIIQSKNISADELSKITQQGQFLQKFGTFQDFVNFANNYYGTSQNATIKQLTMDHLKSITPQYFDDNRTLQDILSGKASNSDGLNINKVFQSAGDQIKEAASGAIQLLSSGYKDLSKNSFEDFVRNNPISIIKYLEEKKNDPNLDPTLIPGINDQIKQLVEFNTRSVEAQIQYYLETNKRLGQDEPANASAIQHNKDLLTVLQGTNDQGGILTELKNYNGSISANKITALYNDDQYPELKLETLDGTINDAVLNEIIKSGLSIQNVHGALYTTEMQEAAKTNANFAERELPKPDDNGDIPEDNAIAPPEVSPTVLSGVIAKIGNEILYKANNLLRNPNIPDSNWVSNNATILKDIDDQIASGVLAPETTAGQAFLNNLRLVFRNVIKQFVTSDVQTYKNSVDQAHQAIDDNNAAIDSKKLDINKLTKSIQIANNQITLKTNQLAQLTDPANDLDQNVIDANSILPTLTQINSKQLKQLEDDLASSDTKVTQQAVTDVIGFLNKDIDKLQQDVQQTQDKLDKDQKNLSSLVNNQDTLLDNYKTVLKAYSDKLTDHFSDDSDSNGTTDIEENFRTALVDTRLDLNNDGINDFQNIQNTIDKISELGDSVSNIFGGKEAQAGGINQQSVRRLILMMFAMSILEYSDWDYNKSQADMSNYTADS